MTTTATWDTETWDAFCGLIAEGWPGTFDDDAANSWRVLLDGVDPADAVAAMRRLLFAGQRFRPSASELLSELRNDPGAPTFDEAYRLIFGQGGILAATPHRANGVLTYASEAERRWLYDEAAIERANGMHPLVGAFVTRYGIDRLRALPVNDPDYGPIRRKELAEAWDRHIDAVDGRDVAALAAGGPRREGLRQLDPLAALGIQVDQAPALEPGDQA